jgi:hypothetical protein
MSSHRITTFFAGAVFLVIALLALYRLLAGFPITVGGVEIGQTSTFFVFVISAALCLMLFRGGKATN